MRFLTMAMPGNAQVWTSTGPAPISDGWTGRMTAVAFELKDANHGLAGRVTGAGVWESRDGGLASIGARWPGLGYPFQFRH